MLLNFLKNDMKKNFDIKLYHEYIQRPSIDNTKYNYDIGRYRQILELTNLENRPYSIDMFNEIHKIVDTNKKFFRIPQIKGDKLFQMQAIFNTDKVNLQKLHDLGIKLYPCQKIGYSLTGDISSNFILLSNSRYSLNTWSKIILNNRQRLIMDNDIIIDKFVLTLTKSVRLRADIIRYQNCIYEIDT